MARIRLKAVAGALGAIAALAAPMVLGPLTVSAQQPAVPQFGGANTRDWPPVFSGEIQATIGNATVILGLVGNRTLREHAFVDVRWGLPTSVRVVDSGAGNPSTNRGKLTGLSASQQQIGWINHYVRQGQVQGPFYVILDNGGGRAFGTYSWMWFSTASDERLPGSSPSSGVLRRNGNYTSRGVQAGGSPLGWSAEFNTAAGGAGLPGGVGR
ncbi:MAG: hypothetical protein U0556_05735 [Dehalococcoidia bacterium]